MLKRLLALWPLAVLAFLYASSVLLFCTSMLSTSTVMRTVATEVCATGTATPLADQVILILIDAMRPDFVLGNLRPFARTAGQCDVKDNMSLAAIWADNRYTGPTLHYMEESLRSTSDASVAYFLVADAPTTTAQRIKAIATGTMPAFLEAGSNFDSEATELDSIVAQMKGSAVLLGDDTWEKLFPNTATTRHWKRAVGVPSFDVADFHSNDDVVLGEIYDALRRETAEAVREGSGDATPHAALVVAHFLGIDHVGHRIDSDNPFMSGKILQLDEMLRNVSAVLRERPTKMNTMLLVMGDHGMTNSGDHGGGSAQETDTFLFAQYFPGALQVSAETVEAPHRQEKREQALRANTTAVSTPAANLEAARRLVRQRWRNRVDAEFDRLRGCRDVAGVPADRLGATYQVDVAATVATLLGRPIPYSSFGRVIPEVLTLANATLDVAGVEVCNLRQLQRYFNESNMRVPHGASWTLPGTTVTQQLADMSYYARRTRTDMHRAGMFVGSVGLLLSAMSLLWSPMVRSYLSLRGSGWVMRWTVVVVVLRFCSVFSNSFVVNEDSELLGLLSSVLLCLCVARAWSSWQQRRLDKTKISSAAQHVLSVLRETHVAFLAVLLVVLRLLVPLLLRYRAHITHTVETESIVDCAVLTHPALHLERAGIFAAGALWAVLYPRVLPPLVVAATCVSVAVVYHVSVVHHVLPLFYAAAYPIAAKYWCRSGCGPTAVASTHAASGLAYRYLVLVLWLASLCNGKVATAVVIGLYGVSLPRLCDVLRAAPVLTQVVVLHLFAFVGFFAEGHQCMLNTIDWNASFVGLPFYNVFLGGVLVLSRTFNAFLLVPVALRVAPHVCHGGSQCCTPEEAATALSKREVDRRPQTETASAAAALTDHSRGDHCAEVRTLLYLYLLVVQSAASCFNGYVQKTHLMLFPIFCPKLLFDAVIALLTSVVVVVVTVVFSV